MPPFPTKVMYAKGKAPVLVTSAEQDKALGKGWYTHPKDAEAGRELTAVERGDDNFNPANAPAPVPKAEQLQGARKPATVEPSPEKKSALEE
jgi:hypothetical protein